MSKISIIMPTYNAGKFVKEAIDSVLKQSFRDFEFIIVDDGSTDNTKSIIQAYEDKRVKLIENRHDFIGSLNLGLASASGEYIARMDADDIMHIDRLKIQCCILDEEPTIAVCSSWMSPFGENIPKGTVAQTAFGVLDHPLLLLLKANMIFHPTVMMRTDFLRMNHLQYEYYECAEDYKLWTEIAKKNGVFYVESQPLLLYRVSEQQVSKQKKEKQIETSLKIKQEILDYLLETNRNNHPGLSKMAEAFVSARDEQLMDNEQITDFFFTLFVRNKNRLIISE